MTLYDTKAQYGTNPAYYRGAGGTNMGSEEQYRKRIAELEEENAYLRQSAMTFGLLAERLNRLVLQCEHGGGGLLKPHDASAGLDRSSEDSAVTQRRRGPLEFARRPG